MPPKRKGRDGRSNNRPPVDHQFKKGQSGNKNGRPAKVAPAFLDLVEKELNSIHSINVGTKEIRLPLKFLLVKQLFRIAIKSNNIKALLVAFDLLNMIEDRDTKKRAASLRPNYRRVDLANMTDEEKTVLYFKALRRIDGEDGDAE